MQAGTHLAYTWRARLCKKPPDGLDDKSDVIARVQLPVAAPVANMARAPAARDLDKELEALRRLPANRLCPSCPASAALGFRDVCVKFGAFVCSDCKAAHQAFSHRVKSLGMSTFEGVEVDTLRSGGNASVAATWLGKLSREQVAAQAPKPGAKHTEWHAWIRRIYEEKEFYTAGNPPPPAGAAMAPAPGGWPPVPVQAALAPPPLPPRRSTGDPVQSGSAFMGAPAPAPALPQPPATLDDLFSGLAQDARTSRSLLDDDVTSLASFASARPQPPVNVAAPTPAPGQLNMDALFGVLPAESREMRALAAPPQPFRVLPPPPPPGPAVPRLAPPPQASSQFPRLI